MGKNIVPENSAHTSSSEIIYYVLITLSSYLNSGLPSRSLYHNTRLTLSSGCDGVMLHGRLVSMPDTEDT